MAKVNSKSSSNKKENPNLLTLRFYIRFNYESSGQINGNIILWAHHNETINYIDQVNYPVTCLPHNQFIIYYN